MRHLSDKALTRLRSGTELPDLGGTRYRLISQVARGGMGVVYAAEDECLQRRVALKVLEISGSEGDLPNRLMREARVLARLEHPGIVPVHDAGTLADGRVFYAMKFVEGQRLDQYIESQASTPDRLRIFLRICRRGCFRTRSRSPPPRSQARQCDGRLVRRDSGNGLGARENLGGRPQARPA
jgi:serine/threonine protein kinase